MFHDGHLVAKGDKYSPPSTREHENEMGSGRQPRRRQAGDQEHDGAQVILHHPRPRAGGPMGSNLRGGAGRADPGGQPDAPHAGDELGEQLGSAGRAEEAGRDAEGLPRAWGAAGGGAGAGEGYRPGSRPAELPGADRGGAGARGPEREPDHVLLQTRDSGCRTRRRTTW